MAVLLLAVLSHRNRTPAVAELLHLEGADAPGRGRAPARQPGVTAPEVAHDHPER
jgi:hypothetical protein